MLTREKSMTSKHRNTWNNMSSTTLGNFFLDIDTCSCRNVCGIGYVSTSRRFSRTNPWAALIEVSITIRQFSFWTQSSTSKIKLLSDKPVLWQSAAWCWESLNKQNRRFFLEEAAFSSVGRSLVHQQWNEEFIWDRVLLISFCRVFSEKYLFIPTPYVMGTQAANFVVFIAIDQVSNFALNILLFIKDTENYLQTSGSRAHSVRPFFYLSLSLFCVFC